MFWAVYASISFYHYYWILNFRKVYIWGIPLKSNYDLGAIFLEYGMVGTYIGVFSQKRLIQAYF